MIEFESKRIMVVVAHPDDEVLGCGGLIFDLVSKKNAQVKVVILGEGLTSRNISSNSKDWKAELEIHNENILEAKKNLGYQDLVLYNLPDNRFDSLEILDITKLIEGEKSKFNPDMIFTHHAGDLNVDHQYTNRAVKTATRPVPGERVKGIFTFETLSATEWNIGSSETFNPNYYFELSEEAMLRKTAALKSYSFEVREFPHPRSVNGVKALSAFRGSQVGVNFCESFCILRLQN